MDSTTVISLGGSLVAPDKVDDRFLGEFYGILSQRIERDPGRRYILVTGGGGPAREYQRAFDKVINVAHLSNTQTSDSADWIGIAATRLNAELVRRFFGRYCRNETVTDPEGPVEFTGRVLVAAGWRPGRSTDYVAVALADKFGADKVINLTNIAQVHTDDPRKNPDARPVADISWRDYRKIVGDEWTPGKNAPFDPIASRLAQEKGVTVVIAKGSELENLAKVLDGEKFFGTTIHP